MDGVVTEGLLHEFRSNHLNPATLHEMIMEDDRALLVSVPPGVGKTHAAHGLITCALENGHDLVVFVTPTRALIAELLCSGVLTPIGERAVVLEPRPKGRCGTLNEEWEALERASCSALAKATLCKGCPHLAGASPCQWPVQMEQIVEGVQVVVLTEQYLALQPTMLADIAAQAGAENPLVIFDEATFLTKAEVRGFTKGQLSNFRSVLSAVHDRDGGPPALMEWCEQINNILDDEDCLYDARFEPNALRSCVVAIQAAGQASLGLKFQYLAHDLALLRSRVTTGRWVRNDRFEVVIRIDTQGFDVVVFSPYLQLEIVEERIQREVRLAIPPTVFRHSATWIANISDSIGSMRSLSTAEHFDRVVDFFLALVLRNKLAGHRTVLVAKKALLSRINDRIVTRSQNLGRPLRCVIGIPKDPFEVDVALINYGMIGINAFENFDALYCVGAYNARPDHVRDVYAQILPPDQRHEFSIRTVDRIRSVVGIEGTYPGRCHARLAAPTFEMLERRVVLQALGRVRPFTSPADIIVFQCDDLSTELGNVEVHPTLGNARTAWNVPLLSRMQTAALGDRMRPMREAGASYATIATAFGVSKSTAHKALGSPPLDELLGRIR
jgi:hypothetical protein